MCNSVAHFAYLSSVEIFSGPLLISVWTFAKSTQSSLLQGMCGAQLAGFLEDLYAGFLITVCSCASKEMVLSQGTKRIHNEINKMYYVHFT